MCTPDLKGTQGSFSQFTTRVAKATYENGSRYPLRRVAGGFAGEIEGPQDTFIEGIRCCAFPSALSTKARSSFACRGAAARYTRRIHRLAAAELPHGVIGAKAAGMARFLLTETEPELSLYMSPINIDPERPALPISHPSYYAAYLANLLGTYATLGMAEDTWALNEGAIDEDAFLRQAYDIYAEREAMFLEALESTRRGVLACVFDTSDRIQHMFYRRLGTSDPHARTIEDMYCRMDELVGKVRPFVDRDAALFVLSDHGFCAFRRGVNINAWLRDNGYLHLHNGARESGSFFEGVDWSRTRAYALGLGGFYLNIRGREAQGIVATRPGEPNRSSARLSISWARSATTTVERPIRAVYATRSLYHGPYLDQAPDFMVGYNEGYRCVVGRRGGQSLRPGPRRQRQGLERRPLRGSGAGAGRFVL
jgi:hypothetical protein